MHELTQWVLDSIRAHGPLSVFIGVIIESVIVPIPSPVIIMGAGSILVAPDVSIAAALRQMAVAIVLPGALASTLGAFIGYGIGFWGGKPLIDKLQRFLGFGWPEVQAMEARFAKSHPGLVIFLLRALPIIPLSLISAASGVLRLPLKLFAFWTLLGSIPRCFLLAYLGWVTRDAYEGLAHRLDSVESLVSAGIVIGAIAAIVWLRWRLQGDGRS